MRIACIALLHVRQDVPHVTHYCKKLDVCTLQDFEHFAPHLWHIIFSVKHERRFAALRLHGRHVFEVRVFQQVLPLRLQCGCQLKWFRHLQCTQHKVAAALWLAQQHFALRAKQNPIPWINAWLSSDNVQVAPQEVEVSSYLVGQIDAEVDTDDLSNFQL